MNVRRTKVIESGRGLSRSTDWHSGTRFLLLIMRCNYRLRGYSSCSSQTRGSINAKSLRGRRANKLDASSAKGSGSAVVQRFFAITPIVWNTTTSATNEIQTEKCDPKGELKLIEILLTKFSESERLPIRTKRKSVQSTQWDLFECRAIVEIECLLRFWVPPDSAAKEIIFRIFILLYDHTVSSEIRLCCCVRSSCCVLLLIKLFVLNAEDLTEAVCSAPHSSNTIGTNELFRTQAEIPYIFSPILNSFSRTIW